MTLCDSMLALPPGYRCELPLEHDGHHRAGTTTWDQFTHAATLSDPLRLLTNRVEVLELALRGVLDRLAVHYETDPERFATMPQVIDAEAALGEQVETTR